MILLVIGLIFIIFAIGYAISPIDIIPDVIPIIGWADDVLIVIPSLGLGMYCIFIYATERLQNIDTIKLFIVFCIITVAAYSVLKMKDVRLRKDGKR